MAAGKCRGILRTVSVLTAVGVLCLPVCAKYGGGSGPADDPYQIWTAEQMNAVGVEPNDWDKHFRLMADLDLSVFTGNQFNIIKRFKGTFDGNHHTISHFTYSAPAGDDTVGLFGQLFGPDAAIQDLGFVDPNIEAAAGCAGALAGHIGSPVSITNCYVRGGRITGLVAVGGLVGDSADGTIRQCYATAQVTGNWAVGGLVGWNRACVVSCYADGIVCGVTDIGGLVGFNEHHIADCYAAGIVSGGKCVGGLVGANRYRVTDCYASGRLSGDGEVGGLIGGAVEDGSSGYYVGGVVAGSFWDVEASGRAVSAGGTGKTTAEMQQSATFSTWNIWADSALWTIDEGNDYPRLPWENRPGKVVGTVRVPGVGTAEDPVLISTADELNLVRLYCTRWDRHFKLTADIDLSAYGETSSSWIGTHEVPFTGTFDGGQHPISSFSCRAIVPDRVQQEFGFFGYVRGPTGRSAEIRDLQLVDAEVNVPGGQSVGLLVGYLDEGGIVQRCRATGRVTGSRAVGALAGEMRSKADVVSCCATAAVTGTWYVGGLVGNSAGDIADCYARGSVTGMAWVGGLVGQAGNFTTTGIHRCYSTGRVTGDAGVGGLVGYGWSDRYSFWDVEICGQTTSTGGKGKTTAEMQTLGMFLAAGWDFAGEAANGTEDIWWMPGGQDYPRLWWEAALE